MSKKGAKTKDAEVKGPTEADIALMQKHGIAENLFYDLKESFTLFDKDNNGQITKAEIGMVFRALGQNPSNKEIQEFLKELDLNENGSVNFEEFIRGVGPTYKLKSENEMINDLHEAFAVFDKNGDGFLSVKELKSALTLLGEKVTEEEAQEMLAVADIDGDNRLNYVEFAKRMAAK